MSPTAVIADTTLVRCVHVSRTYASATATTFAVRDADCAIEAGEHIALVGPSGSGKSTLLHLLAGLDTPTAGEIAWPALGPRDRLRPGPVGVVFQSPSLLPPLDVIENVALPLLLAGTDPDAARRRALDALQELDLDALAGKLPDELSGGQAQRVAVARILASQPRLILADEPTGQLDRATAERVVTALVETAARLGAGLVVNTHDPAVSERFGVRWTMADGHLTTEHHS